MVIGDHYFELEFEVEKMGFHENGEEAIIEWNGGCSGEGEEQHEGAALQDGEKGLWHEAKRQKMEVVQVEGSQGDVAVIGNITKASRTEQVQNMKEEEFEAFLRRKAEEILNMVAARVIDETADEVMEDEEEEGQLIGAPGASPPTNPTPAPTLGLAATTTFSPSLASGALPTPPPPSP